MDTESYSPIVERITTSPIFKRLIRNFELYQKLYEKETDEKQKQVIKQRMAEVFLSDLSERSEDEEINKIKDLYKVITENMLVDCENGSFKCVKFIDLVGRSKVGERIVGELNYKPRTVIEDEQGRYEFVNEVITYNFKKDRDYISINIPPTSVVGTEQLILKVFEGFKAIAEELKSGQLEGVEKVKMVSWLFGKEFENKVKMIFGDNIKLEDFDGSDVREITHLALVYNSRALEKYLIAGVKPEVKYLEMTKDEFIKKFE